MNGRTRLCWIESYADLETRQIDKVELSEEYTLFFDGKSGFKKSSKGRPRGVVVLAL